MQLEFIKEAANVILCGPNGVGKSTIAKNIAHHTIIRGSTVLFTTAGDMLNELAAQDGNNALSRRIKYYVHPTLLVIDEVGYLSYSNRHADLFFEIISKRYNDKSIIVTTNKQFSEWTEIFKNALLRAPLYKAGKILTFYKAVQVGAAPMRIELVVRNPEFFGPMQYAFFENILRKEMNLKSTPIEFKSRTKKGPVV